MRGARLATRGLTAWSVLTLLLAIPVWMLVFRSAVLSRIVDGGIFLSVSGGVAQGLQLYEQVWDNKDPLFFAVMAIAMQVHEAAPFFLDVVWIVVGAVGAALIARSVMSADRALFIGAVMTPLLLIGPLYVPGWTNTPGTVLILLGVGFLMSQRAVAAGVVLGLLAFTKLTVWPIGLAAIVIGLLLPTWRRSSRRAFVAMAATMGALVATLAALGWLAGAWQALLRNRAYASDVAAYFDYEPSIVGRWSKALADWSVEFRWSVIIAMAVIVSISLLWLVIPPGRTSNRILLATWALVALVGLLIAMGLTYVWPHHGQALSLAAILAAILIAATIPDRWPFVIWMAVVVTASFLVSGWGSLSVMRDVVNQRLNDYDIKVAEISETPPDAVLLRAVPLTDFTYARLGTNDDRGFLADVRSDATLACPQFHLYDFSPDSAFTEALSCIQGVDVVVITDAFVTFGNGGKAAVVQPILTYVDAEFDCLRVDDRRVCSRK